MDWGLITAILVIVVWMAHVAFDGYRMWRSLRFLRHVKYEALDNWQCERCKYIQDRLDGMRHEAIWTAAAIIALIVHVTLDFVG